MDEQSKKLLEETHNLAERNNEMLHKMQKRFRRQDVFGLLRWVIIIGIGVGAFYFIQPYITMIQGLATDAGNAFDQFKSIFPSSN